MKVLIVGLGLIGGSYAKAIKKNTKHEVYAVDNDPDVVDAARRCGAIDGAVQPDQLGGFGLIILALYPAGTIEFMRGYAGKIEKQTVVIDSCGVKQSVSEQLQPIADRYGFCYIGAHPMAGKERGGFGNSSGDLFSGASFIMTPLRKCAEQCGFLEKLMREIGFEKVVCTTPQRHDEMIAYTSQLPHVLACAYILDKNAKSHDGFSAGSFRDVSRVALINEELWTQLFLDNHEALSEQIGRLIENLTLLKSAIDDRHGEALKDILRKGREIKEEIC